MGETGCGTVNGLSGGSQRRHNFCGRPSHLCGMAKSRYYWATKKTKSEDPKRSTEGGDYLFAPFQLPSAEIGGSQHLRTSCSTYIIQDTDRLNFLCLI